MPPEWTPVAVDRPPAPDRIGPYRVLKELHTGGMGTVYLAEQREPIRRQVAVKVIKAGFDSAEVIARFPGERLGFSMETVGGAVRRLLSIEPLSISVLPTSAASVIGVTP